MQPTHFSFVSAAFRSASLRSTSAFGTWISFFIKSVNAPNPLGFRSGLSVIALILLLNAHETSVANGGELLVCDTLADHPAKQIQEAGRVRQLADVVPSDSIASLIRCSMNQAVFWVTPNALPSSWLLIPLRQLAIDQTATNHLLSGSGESSKMVPTFMENCFWQAARLHLIVPGRDAISLQDSLPHVGHTMTPDGHLISRMKSLQCAGLAK